MRNLKKVLSLVLALMMVLSVMVTASAADFADAADIEYKEAVEVLTAAGVLNGVKNDDDTYSFLPHDTLNREAAAKMVAYLVLGGDVPAAVVDALNNPFTDVNGWSEAVIKYCYSEGIVDGVNATTFLPKDKLTGYAFAKMLLVAIGVDGEYTGSSWKLNVYTAAEKAGLLEGLENVVLSGYLTREQAAQMAFNAGKANGTTTILGYMVNNNPNLVFSTYLEAYVIGGNNPANVTTLTTTSGDLLSGNFGIVPGSRNADAFGRPLATVWENAKGEEIYSELQTPVKTYTSAVTAAQVRSDLGLAKDADVSKIVTANGKLVELYLKPTATKISSQDDLQIVEVNYNAANVVVGKADTEGNVKYTLDGVDYYDYSDAYVAKLQGTVSDSVVLAGTIVDGAWVTYTVKNGVAYVYPTTSISGLLSGKNATAGTLTINGGKLSVSAAAGSTAVADYVITGIAAAYSVDQYGYVVGLTPVETEVVIPTEFVYVYAIQAQGYEAAGSSDLLGNASGTGKDAKAVASVVFTDGTVGVINLAITSTTTSGVTTYSYVKPASDGSVSKVDVETLAATSIGAWFAYTVKDGAYTLAPVSNSAAYATVLSNDSGIEANKTAKIANKYTNSATVITAVNTAANKYGVTTVTGLHKANIALAAGKTLVTYAPNSNVISNIYVVDYAIPTVSAPVVYDYYYAVAAGDEVLGGTEWTFYVNGKTVTYTINGDQPEAGNVYYLKANDGDLAGTHSLNGAAKVLSAVAKVELADATFFVAGGNTYYYSQYGCEVYNVTTGTAYGADTIEAGDYVTVLTDANGAILVYIVDEPAD